MAPKFPAGHLRSTAALQAESVLLLGEPMVSMRGRRDSVLLFVQTFAHVETSVRSLKGDGLEHWGMGHRQLRAAFRGGEYCSMSTGAARAECAPGLPRCRPCHFPGLA